MLPKTAMFNDAYNIRIYLQIWVQYTVKTDIFPESHKDLKKLKTIECPGGRLYFVA